MPTVSASVDIPQQRVRLLLEAYETYKEQKGLGPEFTQQMFLDEIFTETLRGQWRMADSAEVAEMSERYEAADDTVRAQVDAILNP